MVLLGDRDLGTCSKVTAVGWMRAERRMTAKPWGPWKAQQLPGCTSGWKGRKSGQCRAGDGARLGAALADPGWNRLPAPWATLLKTLLSPLLGAYLEDDPRRLGVVPQRDAEEAEEGRLGLVGLRTSGADHTGP